MCGRYAASTRPDQLIEIFEVDQADAAGFADWDRPRWNIAPTDRVPAVLERTAAGGRIRRLTGLRWGLIPGWSRTTAGAARMINARFETVARRPAFRRAFAARRCLLPADGYYEWYPTQLAGRSYKQPFYIHPVSGIMAMAGIYEFWRDPTASGGRGNWLASCAILTATATDEFGRLHDRMPVQVAPQNWAAWLDPELTDPVAAAALANVPEPGQMLAHAVSTRVNRVGNDGPELVTPLPTG